RRRCGPGHGRGDLGRGGRPTELVARGYDRGHTGMVPPAMGQPDLVIVSNRGPLSFIRAADGELVTTHGAGGLVSSLAPAVAGAGATWVASAITDADREAAAAGPVELDELRVRSMVIEPEAYRQYYDVVANPTL